MSGITTFDYLQPLSHWREDYLISQLEKLEYAKTLQTKALITANLMSSPGMLKEASNETFKVFGNYIDLVLPSDEKSSSIKEMTREDKLRLSTELKEANKKLREMLAKEAKLKPVKPVKPYRPKRPSMN